MFPVSAVSLLDSGVPSPICLTVNETSRHSEQHPLFSGRSRRADYLQLYPELDQLCERFGFGWGDALADWSYAPEWMLLALARAARPPLPMPIRVSPSASHSDQINELIARHRPLDSELRRLGIIVQRLASTHAHTDVRTLSEAFNHLRHDVHLHLLHGEMVVFPLHLARKNACARPRPPLSSDFTSALGFLTDGHREIACQADRIPMQIDAALTSCRDPDFELVSSGVTALAAGFKANAAAENAVLLSVMG